MNRVLQPVYRQCAFPYIDDVLIWSPTFDKHLEDISTVLSLLREHNLKINPSKSFFMRKEVPFLGHIVSKDGIKTDPEKITAIEEFP